MSAVSADMAAVFRVQNASFNVVSFNTQIMLATRDGVRLLGVA